MNKKFTINDIIAELESFAPLSYQENYDNAGLIVGDKNAICKSALLTIDTTEEVVDEAIRKRSKPYYQPPPNCLFWFKKAYRQKLY
jgi:hypothetical protein